MSVDTKFASHRWTPKGSEAYHNSGCGECPVCKADNEHVTTEWSCGSGDGETMWLEMRCLKCDTEWADCYQVTKRAIYLTEAELQQAQKEAA